MDPIVVIGGLAVVLLLFGRQGDGTKTVRFVPPKGERSPPPKKKTTVATFRPGFFETLDQTPESRLRVGRGQGTLLDRHGAIITHKNADGSFRDVKSNAQALWFEEIDNRGNEVGMVCRLNDGTDREVDGTRCDIEVAAAKRRTIAEGGTVKAIFGEQEDI